MFHFAPENFAFHIAILHYICHSPIHVFKMVMSHPELIIIKRGKELTKSSKPNIPNQC
jgi:hypothetical protein